MTTSIPFSLLALVVVAWPMGMAHAETAAPAASVAPGLALAESLAARQELDAAIDAYKVLLREGNDLPELRYNLGTLLLARSQVGPAILHLTAALREDPWHEDAAFNLERAIEARTDRITEIGGTAQTPPLASRIPPFIARAATALALFVLGLLVALLPWVRARAYRRLVRRVRQCCRCRHRRRAPRVRGQRRCGRARGRD